MQSEPARYRVGMDERWKLRDLYDFPHAFIQVYAFVYCFDSDLPAYDAERINYALQEYPWKGGYSYVNIYTVLENQVNVRHRPLVAEIRYASPGYMDLLLHIAPALKIGGAVMSLIGMTVTAAKAYDQITKIFAAVSLRRREKRVLELKLTLQEVQELTKLSKELAKAIKFEGFELLAERTKSTEVASKLLASHYRRLKILAGFVREGKAQLPSSLPLPLPLPGPVPTPVAEPPPLKKTRKQTRKPTGE
ncbi:hypothetical protein [Lysobacter antibioticus]|uniref:hypothetical protein n=1 Tax=Lysobacter antibioticus TaxID=84531 RepID=UPI000A8E00DF|nr:hypothetical protein [Lysobacter antibioticus]